MNAEEQQPYTKYNWGEMKLEQKEMVLNGKLAELKAGKLAIAEVALMIKYALTAHAESERAKALRQAAECIRTLGEQHVAVQGSSRSISQATREEHAKAIEELMEDGHE